MIKSVPNQNLPIYWTNKCHLNHIDLQYLAEILKLLLILLSVRESKVGCVFPTALCPQFHMAHVTWGSIETVTSGNTHPTLFELLRTFFWIRNKRFTCEKFFSWSFKKFLKLFWFSFLIGASGVLNCSTSIGFGFWTKMALLNCGWPIIFLGMSQNV